MTNSAAPVAVSTSTGKCPGNQCGTLAPTFTSDGRVCTVVTSTWYHPYATIALFTGNATMATASAV